MRVVTCPHPPAGARGGRRRAAPLPAGVPGLMRTLDFVSGGTRLAASLHPGPGPAVVLLHGSGAATRESVSRWIDAAVGVGLTVFAYDKPGCGESAGDWRHQDFADRAGEAADAVTALRAQPEVAGRTVSLLGGSQGGWIALLALPLADVDAAVCVSTAGVTVAEQERYRVRHQLPALGFGAAETGEAAAFLDRRLARLAAGEDPGLVHADERRFADRPWRAAVGDEDRAEFDFDVRIYDFDPVPSLRAAGRPILAVWGGADVLVPVGASLDAFSRNLPAGDCSALVVLPQADHGLRVGRPGGPPEFAAGLWPLVAAWLDGVPRTR